MTPAQLDTIARACHEANRAWCLAHGDASQKSYDDADEWQRESARRGVGIAVAGAGPAEQHEAWCVDKVADGWVWGPAKDPTTKRHPCLVAYCDLPAEQKAKDGIYIAVVLAFAAAFNPVADEPATSNDGPFECPEWGRTDLADYQYAAPDLSADELETIKLGQAAFREKYASKIDGEGAQWGWLIYWVGWRNFARLAAMDINTRIEVIADLKHEADLRCKKLLREGLDTNLLTAEQSGVLVTA